MEKYGTVPKRFTKGWWEWFWEYYKIHVLAGAFVLLLAGVTIYQAVTKPHYDITVTYMGECSANESQLEQIDTELETVVPDVNGNGKTDVFFQVLTSGSQTQTSVGTSNDAEYTMAIETKKMFELQMGDSFVFVTNKAQMDGWYANELAQDMFTESDSWLTEENKSCERAEGLGEKYFVKVPNTSIFSEVGFATGEDLYVAVRVIRENEDKEQAEKIQSASFDAANYILRKR